MMFESAELDVPLSKADYDETLPELRYELFKMQQSLKAAGIPTIILIDGVPGSGRGAVMNFLNEVMDSRGIKNHIFWKTSDEEKARPEYWRYWRLIPGKGEMGVFLGAWHWEAVRHHSKGKKSESHFDKAMQAALDFEKTLAADGVLIIKLWLHLSENAANDVLKKFKEKSIDIDPFDEDFDKLAYKQLIKYYARLIRTTDVASSHWYIINCHNERQRNISIIKTLNAAMHNALEIKNHKKSYGASLPISNIYPTKILDTINLTKKLDKDDYEEKLQKYREELYKLSVKAYKRGLSTVIVFEGWDAAGKGGTIRRLTSAIDARICRTIQVGSPTDEEKKHHYLWRFWGHIPASGFFTIYDRSWYGRVLVERVEELAGIDEWTRAYSEINDFETQLVENGCLLLKFWLQISQEEQLKRFKEREELDYKRYKITPEDWRNREKFSAYNDAVEDMFIRTSTDIAPWQIIPAENKRYARIEALSTLCSKLKERL